MVMRNLTGLVTRPRPTGTPQSARGGYISGGRFLAVMPASVVEQRVEFGSNATVEDNGISVRGYNLKLFYGPSDAEVSI
jgi:hypothetical protein